MAERKQGDTGRHGSASRKGRDRSSPVVRSENGFILHSASTVHKLQSVLGEYSGCRKANPHKGGQKKATSEKFAGPQYDDILWETHSQYSGDREQNVHPFKGQSSSKKEQSSPRKRRDRKVEEHERAEGAAKSTGLSMAPGDSSKGHVRAISKNKTKSKSPRPKNSVTMYDGLSASSSHLDSLDKSLSSVVNLDKVLVINISEVQTPPRDVSEISKAIDTHQDQGIEEGEIVDDSDEPSKSCKNVVKKNHHKSRKRSGKRRRPRTSESTEEAFVGDHKEGHTRSKNSKRRERAKARRAESAKGVRGTRVSSAQNVLSHTQRFEGNRADIRAVSKNSSVREVEDLELVYVSSSDEAGPEKNTSVTKEIDSLLDTWSSRMEQDISNIPLPSTTNNKGIKSKSAKSHQSDNRPKGIKSTDFTTDTNTSDFTAGSEPAWLQSLTATAQAYAHQQQVKQLTHAAWESSGGSHNSHHMPNNMHSIVPTHPHAPTSQTSSNDTAWTSVSPQSTPRVFQSLTVQSHGAENRDLMLKQNFNHYSQNIPSRPSGADFPTFSGPHSGADGNRLQTTTASRCPVSSRGFHYGPASRLFRPPAPMHTTGTSSSTSSHRHCHSDNRSGHHRTCQQGQDAAVEKPVQSPGCPELSHSHRHWHTVNKVVDPPAGSMEFSVMSYNILSQELLEQHPYLYERCEDEALDWRNRGPALVHQILAHNADVVCLQEVQEDHWTLHLREIFQDHGYGSFYKKKSGDKCDGCAVLYKTNKFNLLKAIPVEFCRGGILDRDNVGVIVLLEPRASAYTGMVRRICVATTHLLFNPKRGDVKLAQLALLLAEIDKYAADFDYSPNLSGSSPRDAARNSWLGSDGARSKMAGADGSDFYGQTRGEVLKVAASGGEIGGAWDMRVDKNVACKKDFAEGAEGVCENSVQDGKDAAERTSYCPVILCGDFNSEPFSDLYGFVTSGELKYEGRISRLLCGQREGASGGWDTRVPRVLLPKQVKISQHCQYKAVTDTRWHQMCRRENAAGMAVSKRQPWASNTGVLQHAMNFKSVYRHYVDRPGPDVQEVTTAHLRAVCTVDYIFYSGANSAQFTDYGHGQRSPGTVARSRSGDSLHDKDINDERGLPSADADNSALVLLSRYRLLTKREVAQTGHMPNPMFPSDHLCLIARFLLR